jgi:hypothetical protein
MTERETAENIDADESSVTRGKVLGLAAGAVLLVVLGLAYLMWASGRVDEDIAEREARAQAAIEAFETSAEPADATETSDAADSAEQVPPVDAIDLSPGSVLVVNRVPGDDYGRLAIRNPDGSRELFERKCMRVHVAADRGVCLSQDESVFAPAFRTEFFDVTQAGLPEVRSYASPLPSRARMTPDGSVASTTGFVSGSSYSDIGGEAETIVTIDEVNERVGLVGLVQFEVLGEASKYAAADRQFWGVSFTTNDEFYVTGFFGDEPEVLFGSRSRRTLEPTGYLGSCPSISPDGQHLVFKETLPEGEYALAVVDLSTGEQWRLGETRSVDDQVEWLDNDTILYAIHPDGDDGTDVQPQFDIWMLDIAPGSEPELFLPAADSPAVLR